MLIMPGSLMGQKNQAATSAPSTLLLDLYGTAANWKAGWSAARKLRGAYSGNAMTVRESGGDTSLGIGFDGDDNLDESALTTHTGANNGLVTKVFDQAASVDAAQTTAANQPRIVNAGTVHKINTRPCLYVADTSDFLTISLAQAAPIYVFAVVDTTNMATGYKELMGRNPTDGPSLQLAISGVGRWPEVFWGADQAAWGQVLLTKYVVRFRMEANGDTGVKVNDGAEVEDTTNATTTLTTWDTIFSSTAAQDPQDVRLGELLVYQGAALSDADSDAIISDQMTYFGIS